MPNRDREFITTGTCRWTCKKLPVLGVSRLLRSAVLRRSDFSVIGSTKAIHLRKTHGRGCTCFALFKVRSLFKSVSRDRRDCLGADGRIPAGAGSHHSNDGQSRSVCDQSLGCRLERKLFSAVHCGSGRTTFAGRFMATSISTRGPRRIACGFGSEWIQLEHQYNAILSRGGEWRGAARLRILRPQRLLAQY